VLIAAGETIWTGDGRHLRVVDVVPSEDDSDVYVGLLMVESVDGVDGEETEGGPSPGL
jgi:hypothetical protein